jgi:hypothetical protein
MIRTALINSLVGPSARPQGLKPSTSLVLGGTAQAVPFPKPIHEDMHIADMHIEDRLLKVRRS